MNNNVPLSFNNKEELIKFIKDEVINTTESTEILGCTRQNLNNLVQRGVLTPIKELHKDKLFFKSDILARKQYMDDKRHQ
ncbi:hypothetical protein [Pseudobacillus badius]|uniref:hypothetical protein n=1 Tax=Bacillus badius TaxID=1455 RepID=UPI0007B3D22C|nr:hypothetical protein [Bacillus badius]KZR57889.1 transcriptional regulator [Bacillus badius]